MFKGIIAFVARRIHNVHIQLLLASIYGLLAIFGVHGTISILMKVRKQHARKTMVPGVRNRNGSIGRTTKVPEVPPEPTRDLRTGPPRTSISETQGEADKGSGY